MQSWARDDDRDAAGGQPGGRLAAEAVAHDEIVVGRAGNLVDARLEPCAQIGRLVVQPFAEQLDIDDVGRPGRGKIERPGENFAGKTHEMHDSDSFGCDGMLRDRHSPISTRAVIGLPDPGKQLFIHFFDFGDFDFVVAHAAGRQFDQSGGSPPPLSCLALLRYVCWWPDRSWQTAFCGAG